MACGPGRTAIDTRRRSDPLQQKERVPDVEETSNEASGPYNGVVIRGSDEFKALSENYDTDIVFKDEKKNGDERRMTKVYIYIYINPIIIIEYFRLSPFCELKREELPRFSAD